MEDVTVKKFSSFIYNGSEADVAPKRINVAPLIVTPRPMNLTSKHELSQRDEHVSMQAASRTCQSSPPAWSPAP